MASEVAAPPRLFVLEDEPHGRQDCKFNKVQPVQLGDAPRCPRCNSPLGLLSWLPPYRVELELYGEALGDLIKGTGNGFLVSERLAAAFQQEGLTGLLGLHPAEVVRVRGRRKGLEPGSVPRYLVADVGFTRATVDVAHSRLRYDKPVTCLECRSAGLDSVHGFVLEPGSWTGEDVFRARGLPGTILVSERFASWAARQGLTNVKLTPTEEYIRDPLRLGAPAEAPRILH